MYCEHRIKKQEKDKEPVWLRKLYSLQTIDRLVHKNEKKKNSMSALHYDIWADPFLSVSKCGVHEWTWLVSRASPYVCKLYNMYEYLLHNMYEVYIYIIFVVDLAALQRITEAKLSKLHRIKCWRFKYGRIIFFRQECCVRSFYLICSALELFLYFFYRVLVFFESSDCLISFRIVLTWCIIVVANRY